MAVSKALDALRAVLSEASEVVAMGPLLDACRKVISRYSHLDSVLGSKRKRQSLLPFVEDKKARFKQLNVLEEAVKAEAIGDFDIQAVAEEAVPSEPRSVVLRVADLELAPN